MNQNSVKLIKAAPGSVYPEHIHPEKTEYAFVLEGNVDITINGDSFDGKAGDFFVFPKQQKHAIKNTSTHDCVLLIGALADKM